MKTRRILHEKTQRFLRGWRKWHINLQSRYIHSVCIPKVRFVGMHWYHQICIGSCKKDRWRICNTHTSHHMSRPNPTSAWTFLGQPSNCQDTSWPKPTMQCGDWAPGRSGENRSHPTSGLQCAGRLEGTQSTSGIGVQEKGKDLPQNNQPKSCWRARMHGWGSQDSSARSDPAGAPSWSRPHKAPSQTPGIVLPRLGQSLLKARWTIQLAFDVVAGTDRCPEPSRPFPEELQASFDRATIRQHWYLRHEQVLFTGFKIHMFPSGNWSWMMSCALTLANTGLSLEI